MDTEIINMQNYQIAGDMKCVCARSRCILLNEEIYFFMHLFHRGMADNSDTVYCIVSYMVDGVWYMGMVYGILYRVENNRIV